MQDAAWAIVLFGGIPATLIFYSGGFADLVDLQTGLREYFLSSNPTMRLLKKQIGCAGTSSRADEILRAAS
jgi:hypothetical protein